MNLLRIFMKHATTKRVLSILKVDFVVQRLLHFFRTMIKRQVLQSVKEIIRHSAYCIGLAGFLDVRRRKRGIKTEHLSQLTVEDKFNSIYKTRAWVNIETQNALSGLGSELAYTSNIRKLLPSILSGLNIGSLIDVGCSDWTWMKELKLPCHYLRIDVVQDAILLNKQYTSEFVEFLHLNALSSPLPVSDIVLCREVLFHFSLDDGLRMIHNIKKSSKYLIATTNACGLILISELETLGILIYASLPLNFLPLCF